MRAVAVLAIAASACGRLHFDEVQRLRLADPGEELDGFPLPVFLADWPDASELEVHASDGSVLPLEIESAGPPVVAWVRVPVIAGADTTLYLLHGGAGSTQPVWDDSYDAVWHMTGPGALADSSPNGNTGTASGTTEVDGIAGPARAFDISTKDSIVVPSLANVVFPTMTAMGWMRFHTIPAEMYYSLVTRENGDGGGDDFFLGTFMQEPFGGITTPTANMASFGPNVGLNEWHHYAMVYDGAQVTLFLDGVAQPPSAITGSVDGSASPVYIGCDRDNGTGASPPGQCDDVYLDGELDEIRLEHVVRSPPWIAYTIAAMQDRVIDYGAP